MSKEIELGPLHSFIAASNETTLAITEFLDWVSAIQGGKAPAVKMTKAKIAHIQRSLTFQRRAISPLKRMMVEVKRSGLFSRKKNFVDVKFK